MSVAPHPTSAHPWLQSHELWAGSGAASAGLSTNTRMKNPSRRQTVIPLCAPLRGTYMSVCVQRVVGELGIVKRDGSALPVSACGR